MSAHSLTPRLAVVLLWGPYNDSKEKDRAAEALLDLIPLDDPDDLRRKYVEYVRTGKSSSSTLRPSLSRQAAESTDIYMPALVHLLDWAFAPFTVALADILGSEVVLRTLLASARDLPVGDPGHEFLLELCQQGVDPEVLLGALCGLEHNYMFGLETTGAFRRFYSARDHHPSTLSYLRLATPEVRDAGLDAAQEEVYYTLLLDGMGFHDAAESALELA